MSFLPRSSRSSFFVHQLLEATHQKNFHKGRTLHAQTVKSGSSCINISNSLISFYAKTSNLAEAHLQFQEAFHKDVVSWNCLINSHVHHGDVGCYLAIKLFKLMRDHNILPNAHTLTGVFTASANSSNLSMGQQIHSLAVKIWGFCDEFVGSTALNMYCKTGLVVDAHNLFDKLPEKNSFSWVTMISGYAMQELCGDAFELFISMRRRQEEENEFIFTSVLSSVACPEFVRNGRQIHCLAVQNGLICFVSVVNALVTMYSKTGDLDDAVLIFESGDKNYITWSALVTGFTQSGRSHEALRIFAKMHFLGVTPTEFTFAGVLNACSDIDDVECGRQVHGYSIKLGHGSQMFIITAMMDMYARSGSVDDARIGFDHVKKNDVVLWTSMITGYVLNGLHEEALELYNKMDGENILPNDLTMASVLRACSNLAALEQGKQIHTRVVKYGFGLEVPIGSALLTMYARCGSLEDGKLAFRRMHTRDLVSWNSVISALSRSGNGHEALRFFEEMLAQGTKPDFITFMNVLSACSHLGLVDLSWSYFTMMSEEFNMIPQVEHYACVVDTLGRAGRLIEAKELIESSDIDHGWCLWRVLLGACRNCHNYEMGMYVGEKLMELGSMESSAYVMLASIYSALGRVGDVERVYNLMRQRNVIKEPGCSWIELKSQIHVFVVGDVMHQDIGNVRAELRRLYKQMIGVDSEYELDLFSTNLDVSE